MKKLFTLSFIFLLLFDNNTFSQSTRLVLAEEFTQASSPPDATQNPAFNTLLNANPTKVCAIKYHTSWPGVDPMNAATQSMVSPRVTYYSVFGVPLGLMDGTQQTGSAYTGAPANWTQSKLNARAAVPSPYTLTVNHTIDVVNDSIHINGNILCTQAVSGTLVLNVVLVEREIEFCTAPGSNGEKIFEGVMQLMIPGSSGTSIASSWTVGQQQSFNFNVKIPSYIYSKAELAVVAFVQNNTTKEVLQTAFSGQQSFATDVILPCGAISNVPIISCGTGISPSVTFKNDGTTNLTSADIVYNVDGANLATYNWTGSLAPGLSATVSIPTLNPPAGTHVLNVSAVNNADHNVYRQTASTKFNLSSPVGSAPPLNQTFASAAFPPAGWIISNPDEAATWTRSTAGLNGAGSAKIDFYNSPSGAVDELVLSNINLNPGGGTANIDFDVAYSQYNSASSDKIEVFYSVDCGQNWISVFNQAGTVLASGNPHASSAWTPTLASQWHHKTASLQSAVGSNNVFVKFKATSTLGNNAYLDNINITYTSGCVNPVFTSFPANTSVNAAAGFCSANVNYTLTTNDPLATLSYVFTGATNGSGSGTGSGQLFKNGTTHVAITVMNACSTLTNSFDITVVSVINDNSVCTIDACDPLTGTVMHTSVNTNDGNICTTDGCDSLTGVFHNPVNISDNNACTSDACDPVTGISHAPISTDDNNLCTADGCNAVTGVFHLPMNFDDGNACTDDACDPLTGISYTPVIMDDGLDCTTDGCDPLTGVYHTPGVEICGNGIDDDCDSQIDEVCTSFHVKLFVEGFYIGNNLMRAVVDSANYPALCDTILVQLHSSVNTSNIFYSEKVLLSTNGVAEFIVESALITAPFYIVIYHRNAIETWSSVAINPASSVIYDFTDLQSKAFGSNLVQTFDMMNYAIYSGDIISVQAIMGKQDGMIDHYDYSAMEIAIDLSPAGYIPEDLTGDGLSESADYVMMENNTFYSVIAVRP